MRLSKLTLVLGGAAMLGCAAPELTQQQRGVEEGLVRDQLDLWATALNNSDKDALHEMYLNDESTTVVWLDGSLTTGFEEQDQAIDNLYNSAQYINFVPQSPVTDVLTASVAITRFRHSADVRFFDTRREVTSGHTTIIWRKPDPEGTWKIFRLHVSVNPAEAF